MPSTRILSQSDRFGTIIGVIVFSLAGGIIPLLFEINDLNVQTIVRRILWGSIVGGSAGGIIGYIISRLSALLDCDFSVTPVPPKVLLLGQFLGSIEGACGGLLHGNTLDATTGLVIGWSLGMVFHSISWIISKRLVYRSLISFQLQLLFGTVCGLLIFTLATRIRDFEHVLFPIFLLTVLSAAASIRLMVATRKRRGGGKKRLPC